jgi:uncharacterized protein DUF6247
VGGMARPAATDKPKIPSKPDPKGIRVGLPPEEVDSFDERFRAAMAEATETLDLAPVMDVLEHYHRLAWTYTADPAGYRRMVDTAARVLACEDVPRVPGDVIKADLAARTAVGR